MTLFMTTCRTRHESALRIFLKALTVLFANEHDYYYCKSVTVGAMSSETPTQWNVIVNERNIQKSCTRSPQDEDGILETINVHGFAGFVGGTQWLGNATPRVVRAPLLMCWLSSPTDSSLMLNLWMCFKIALPCINIGTCACCLTMLLVGFCVVFSCCAHAHMHKHCDNVM